MKKPLYKDKFVTIGNSDIKRWAWQVDTVWSIEFKHKSRKKFHKLMDKYKVDPEDDQYDLTHHEYTLFLSDIIHGLCNIIQDERKEVAEFKEEVKSLISTLNKL